MDMCGEPSNFGPQLPSKQERQEIAERLQASFDNEDDYCPIDDPFFDQEEIAYMEHLCNADQEVPETPDKPDVLEDENPKETPDGTQRLPGPMVTPSSSASNDNTPSVATVETPPQPSPSSSPETILPVRCEIHGRSLGATVQENESKRQNKHKCRVRTRIGCH